MTRFEGFLGTCHFVGAGTILCVWTDRLSHPTFIRTENDNRVDENFTTSVFLAFVRCFRLDDSPPSFVLMNIDRV